MRFTLIKNLQDDNSMKPILNGLLLFMILYVIVDFFVTHSTIGLNVISVKTTLYGNVDEFLDPINASVFLEYIHSQIFFMMMILLTLCAVFARLVKQTKLTIIIINFLMISSLGTLLFLGLSYSMDALFIKPYILLFISWHTMALYMIVHSLWKLNFAKSI